MQEKILIVRLSALGDTVLTLPLLFTLREQKPDAYIGWVVEEKSASLLKDLPGIDKLHIWKMSEKNLGGAWRLAKEIRAVGYDSSIDAQGLMKSAALPLLAGIPNRVGFKRAPLESRELSPIFNNNIVSPPEELTHISLRTQYLARGVGIEPPYSINQKLPLQQDALVRMKRWWDENSLGDKVIVFGVGTSWVTKIWPVEHMASVVAEAEKRGYKALVTWGPDEKDKLDSWRKVLGESVIWSPETSSVAELAALISLGKCYAGPDSAPLHIAWMLGLPTFSWFGASCSKRGAPPSESDVHVIAHAPTRERKGEMMYSLLPETVIPEFTTWLDKI